MAADTQRPAARRMTRRRGVTQADVAAMAGVSTASVSRVLNGSPLVRKGVQARVERAVEALGYVPHSAARALALDRTYTVGAAIPTLNNAIFAEGVNAFERALRQRGYTLLLSVYNYDAEAERTVVDRMIERGVDAVMLVGTDHDERTLQSLERTGIPFVCTYAYAPERGLPNIGFDNCEAMGEVVDHLLGLGHSRIAMLAGVTGGNDRARDRVEGVRRALAARGFDLADERLLEVAYRVDAARVGAARLLAADPRPTALVCGNDVIAYGALFFAAAARIAVPGELSVVGFDDLELSEGLPPGLTTVSVPAAAMGEAAAQRLVDVVEGLCDPHTTAPIRLPTRFVARRTTGPAPE